MKSLLLAQVAPVIPDPAQVAGFAKDPLAYLLLVALGVIGYLYREGGKKDAALIAEKDKQIALVKETMPLSLQLSESVRAAERLVDKLTK